jgi:hypothetical protein
MARVFKFVKTKQKKQELYMSIHVQWLHSYFGS